MSQSIFRSKLIKLYVLCAVGKFWRECSGDPPLQSGFQGCGGDVVLKLKDMKAQLAGLVSPQHNATQVARMGT